VDCPQDVFRTLGDAQAVLRCLNRLLVLSRAEQVVRQAYVRWHGPVNVDRPFTTTEPRDVHGLVHERLRLLDRDRWVVPNVSEDPVEWAYGAEVQIDVVAGFSLALRCGLLDFRSVDDGQGAASTRPGGRADWDHDIARYEIGVGYRLARNAGLLGMFMHNQNEEQYGGDPTDDLFAVRLWWAF